MSLPLKDIRSAVDETTDETLEAIARLRGVTKGELVRGILQAWRDEQLAIAESLRKVVEGRRR